MVSGWASAIRSWWTRSNESGQLKRKQPQRSWIPPHLHHRGASVLLPFNPRLQSQSRPFPRSYAVSRRPEGPGWPRATTTYPLYTSCNLDLTGGARRWTCKCYKRTNALTPDISRLHLPLISFTHYTLLPRPFFHSGRPAIPFRYV